MSIDAGKVLAVAQAVAAAEPQIAILLKAVQMGYLGVKAVHELFADSGHDPEVLAGIVSEFDRRHARWQNTTF